MMDLRNFILEKKDHLPKQTGKLVNRLYNKIKLDSYYPDNKNVIKLKEFSTVEINNFLLECLAEYDKTERLFCEHHDIVGLRGVWAVLAFSKEENVLKYFDELIDKYIFYLNYLAIRKFSTLYSIRYESIMIKFPMIYQHIYY